MFNILEIKTKKILIFLSNKLIFINLLKMNYKLILTMYNMFLWKIDIFFQSNLVRSLIHTIFILLHTVSYNTNFFNI